MIETWIDSGMLLNRKHIHRLLLNDNYRFDLKHGQLNINKVLLDIVEQIEGNVWQAYIIKEDYTKVCKTIIKHIRVEYGKMYNSLSESGQTHLRDTAKELLYRLANSKELTEGGFDFFEEERRMPVYPGELKPGDYVWDGINKRTKQVRTEEEVEIHIYTFKNDTSNIDRFASEEEVILMSRKLHVKPNEYIGFETEVMGDTIKLKWVGIPICNADCPDVEYGNCCHPSNCKKKYIS